MSITAQPVDQSVVAGQPVQLSVVAANVRSFQWQENRGTGWTDVAGATQATLVLPAVDVSFDTRQYRVALSGASGVTLSSAVTLRVTPIVIAASITVAPASQIVIEGQDVAFNVTATGTSLRYQWQSSPDATTWGDVTGATGATLSIGPAARADDGRGYRVVVSNSAGSVVSGVALLRVEAAPSAPMVIAQPASTTVVAGQPASFVVAVSGTPLPSVRWQSSANGTSWSDIAGAVSATYNTGATSLNQNGLMYRAVVDNTQGSVTSASATLTVQPAPVAPSLSTQPQNVTVAAGAAATFSAVATGTPTPSLQWQISSDGSNWTNVTGATGATLTVQSVSASDHNRLYRMAASNVAGTVVSDAGALVVSAAAGSSGSLTRLAGQLGGAGGLDGTGAAARFSAADGMAQDSAGNLFVADWLTHTVRRVTPAGVVTTFAGAAGQAGAVDGVGASARFSGPQGIAIDRDDYLYVADVGNNTIRKIAPSGRVTTLATVSQPRAVAVDAAGALYVAGYGSVVKVAQDGTVTPFAGLNGGQYQGHADGVGTAARFDTPRGIAIDASGNLFVADAGSHTVRRITPSGVVSTLAGSPGMPGAADGVGSAASFNQPTHVAVDAAGNVYVADTENRRIRRVTPAGVVSTVAGAAGPGAQDGPVNTARFVFPQGLASTPSGELFVGDGRRVLRISAGIVSTLAGAEAARGATDGPGASASFNTPLGLAADGVGNAYVADTFNVLLRRVAADSTVTTIAGAYLTRGNADGVGSAATFDGLGDVAIDQLGNLYVPDANNHTIRRITVGGSVSTFAGLAGVSGSADGVGSAARFNSPRKLAIDAGGNLYVSDGMNHTIRRIAADATVTTIAGAAGQAGSVDGPGVNARFDRPGAIAMDGAGNLFVADGAYTVRRIDALGNVSTLAGTAGQPGSVDSSGATARFRTLTGIAVVQGTVYVADSGNCTVRRIASNGAVGTVAGISGQCGVRLGSDARLGSLGGLAAFDNTRLLLTAEDAVLVLALQ